MDSVARYYHTGEKSALDRWNGGEGQRSGSCVGKVGVHSTSFSKVGSTEVNGGHKLAANLVKADEEWIWGGEGPFKFLPDGTLGSSPPWGGATWGTVPSPWRKDTVHVTFPGNRGTHLLMFLSEKWSFVAVRCDNEKVTYGAVTRSEVPEKRLVF